VVIIIELNFFNDQFQMVTTRFLIGSGETVAKFSDFAQNM
jgi:hypothetical protein